MHILATPSPRSICFLPVETPPLVFLSVGIPPAKIPPIPGRLGREPPPPPPPPPGAGLPAFTSPTRGELRSLVTVFLSALPFCMDFKRALLSPPPPPPPALLGAEEGGGGPGAGGGPGGGGGGGMGASLHPAGELERRRQGRGAGHTPSLSSCRCSCSCQGPLLASCSYQLSSVAAILPQ